MYHNHLGIDIGKDNFFVVTHGEKGSKEYSNQTSDFDSFYMDYESQLKDGLVVLETTGGYELALLRYLQLKGCAVHRANTMKVKSFIRSHGTLGKSDSIDARGLAQYGFERDHCLNFYEEPEHVELLHLVGRRNELTEMRAREKNRLQAPDKEHLSMSYTTIIDCINSEIRVIEEKIDAILEANPTIQEKREVLESIDGIGPVSSLAILMLLPELGRVNRKEIASLAGLAPHPNESGKKVGRRYIRGGRKEVKAALHLPAMSVTRTTGQLGQKYNEFIERGKEKMVALTAIKRKIIVIANARLKEYYQSKELVEQTMI